MVKNFTIARLLGLPSRALRRVTLLLLTALALTLSIAVCAVVRAPIALETPAGLIRDVTQLNPITVDRVIVPTTTQEIVDAVSGQTGAISVGGARHSMGGQIAAAGGLHIDMRKFDQVVAFRPEEKRITVQAGARWRQIQETIDPHNLSVAIMQSYADFTVGGSLSVNGHGRYVGQGPIILSVMSLKVVLADGSLVEASSTVNADTFHGVIGGYGGLGVITEATLELADNTKIKRTDRTMPVAEYRRYHAGYVLPALGAVFHHGDLYPDGYDAVHAVTYAVTEDPVTVPERLRPANQTYRWERFGMWVVSEWPFGKALRRRMVDPVYYRGEPVSWRNHEASYATAELEPASRATSTYALSEYFVPVDRFDDFVPRLRDVLTRHDVNVVNVSIRHAKQDPGSLLAWARTDVFAFVLYYKQSTGEVAQHAVGEWTRELIEAALGVGGSFYLPYQLHATEAQFRRAYPRAAEWFALKRRLDPANKFRNALWNKYDPVGRVYK